MHRILLTIGLLMVAVGAACTIDLPSGGSIEAEATQPSAPGDGPRWRRTANGWERADLWPTREVKQPIEPTKPRPIHPIFVAGAILAISVASLALLKR